jgi:hypothetical protein
VVMIVVLPGLMKGWVKALIGAYASSSAYVRDPVRRECGTISGGGYRRWKGEFWS